MRIQSNYAIKQTPYFGASIIDSHGHSGVKESKWNNAPFPSNTLDEFIKQPLTININGKIQTDNVKKVLVSSIDGLSWAEKQQKEVEASGRNRFNLKPEELIFEKDEIQANIDMINKHKENPIYEVMAVCQPTKTKGKADNIRKLIKENEGIIAGLKFHPQGLMLNADSELYDDYLNLAAEKKLPVLFHSQVSINYDLAEPLKELNWSDPEYIYKLAKRHPDVPVILGHTGAGGAVAHNKTINILMQSIENNDAKLYAEISWMDFVNGEQSRYPESILNLIEKLKRKNCLDRILFGTDAPLGCYGERLVHDKNGRQISAKQSYENTIGRIKSAIENKFGDESESIINKIFYDNADELFFKKHWAHLNHTDSPATSDTIKEGAKKLSKTKLACYITACIAIVGAAAYILTKTPLAKKIANKSK